MRWSKVLLCALLLVPSGASAQEGASKLSAEALFREGRRLADAGEHALACEKFAESQRLEPAAGTMLNIGDCNERLGRTASAWIAFKDAARLAVARNRADWEETARQRATRIEPRLSTLAVRVATEVPELRIERDGAQLTRGEWSVAVPVDPGRHVVAASAPGRRSWRTDVPVGPDADKVVVVVPALEPLTAPATVAPEAPASGSSASSATRVTGFGLVGLGLVGLGIGAFTGVRALGLRDDAASLCVEYPTNCSSAGAERNDEAQTNATVATIGVAVGATAALVGVLLLVLGPKKTAASSLVVDPVMDRGGRRRFAQSELSFGPPPPPGSSSY